MECLVCTRSIPDGSEQCPHCQTRYVDPSEQPTAAVPPSLDLTSGSIFADRYTIVEQTAQGGMGIVYKAIDNSLGEEVALKLIRPHLARTPRFVDRFKREVRVTRQLTHANICRVYDLGEAGGTFYLSMEWIRGETLSKLLKQTNRLDRDRALEIAEKICSALSAAHALGVVHRDLKPGNVMIDDGGEVFVLDFGLATEPGEDTQTEPSIVAGTYGYIAPEQAKGQKVDVRADLYPLGIMLCEMVTGERPDPEDISSPATRSSLGTKLARLVSELAAEDRERRPANAEVALTRIRELRTPPKGLKNLATGVRRYLQTMRAGRAATLAIAVVLAGVILWNLMPRPAEVTEADVFSARGYDYLWEHGETVGDIDDAISAFNRAVLADPACEKAFAGRSEAYTRLFERTGDTRNQELASQDLARAKELGGDLLQTKNAEARGFTAAAKYAEAAEVLSAELKVEEGWISTLFGFWVRPDQDEIEAEAMAWANLGRASDRLQKYADAKDAYEHAVELWPDNAAFQIYVGNTYIRFGEYGAAEEAYQRATELKPESDNAWRNLGLSQIQLDHPEKALAALERSLEIEESSTTLGFLGTAYYYLGRYGDAADTYRRAVEVNPDDPFAHANLGDALKMLGQQAEAKASYGEAVRLVRNWIEGAPGDADLRAFLSRWLVGMRNQPAARAEAARALEISPQSLQVLIANAVVSCDGEQDDEALDYLERAVQLGLGKPDIKYDVVLRRLHDNERFQQILARAH
jgi:serine/threonine protein kinase/predicted TPR repeat methyltransferase